MGPWEGLEGSILSWNVKGLRRPEEALRDPIRGDRV